MKFEEVESRARAARENGAEVVLVLGLGFVGTAVVANLSRTYRGTQRTFFVIGLDQDSANGREKVARLDAGHSPTYADDPSLERVIGAAGAEPWGTRATRNCLAARCSASVRPTIPAPRIQQSKGLLMPQL